MRIFESNICDVRKEYEKLKSENSELLSSKTDKDINLLKPKIQQLYALPTLYLRVLYLSRNKQRLLPHTT